MPPTIGLIGAGLLGSALAERLLAAGFPLTVYDTDPARTSAAAGLGARPSSSANDAATAATHVILCLPDSNVSAAVLETLRSGLAAETIVIDTTTGEPAQTEQLAGQAPRYVDATIAGSSQQVRQGEAIVMAGGAVADIESCRPIFAAFSTRSFHTGGPGSGARMKLAVNLVLGLNRAALAEGLAFASACGVDMALALEVLRSGPAYSTAMDRKGPRMLRRDWAPEARLRQHHKDVRLILAEARRHGARVPLSELHQSLLTEAEQAGFADADNSAIFETYLLPRPSTE
jgi:3-hydroxyisobutyrate dehydrogenase-like beta-hydroxyacid dehydrogenase